MRKKNTTNTRLILTSLLFLLTILMLAGAAYSNDPSGTSTASKESLFMFVQVAEDIVVDKTAKTFRLVNVNQQTLFFSDRPDRIAGHLKMPKYLDEWTPKAGKDNFSANPPNASLSVYEPEKEENILAVVEITNPQVSGSDFVYNYTLIEGDLPESGGATALFIDRIGIGGGVGVGYHGVGVGLRGPGRL